MCDHDFMATETPHERRTMIWLTYWNEAATGKFHQQQAHTEADARVIAEALIRSGKGVNVHVEQAEPYQIAR